jgi:hypothetical protein
MIAAAIFGTAALGIGLESAEASERAARCVVEGRQTSPYDGPCLFQASRGGSFTIDPPRGRTFIGDVTTISVGITGRGVAEVRGLVGGVNSRWGRAVRSTRQPACWVGEDFRVCAY